MTATALDSVHPPIDERGYQMGTPHVDLKIRTAVSTDRVIPLEQITRVHGSTTNRGDAGEFAFINPPNGVRRDVSPDVRRIGCHRMA